MLMIGYGIAALIVLILLIVFNVRATSRRAHSDSKAGPVTQPEQTAQPAVREAEPAPPPAASGTPEPTQDQDYRDALRRWRNGKEIRNEPPAATEKTADAGYRDAMRRLRKPADPRK